MLRGFDELMRADRADLFAPRWPVLFSAFLDSRRITTGRSLMFSVELAVSTTGYTIDGRLFLDHHVPGEHLFRDTVTVRLTRAADGWSVRYALTDGKWGEAQGRKAEEREGGFVIPLSSSKGFKARLWLRGSGMPRELGEKRWEAAGVS